MTIWGNQETWPKKYKRTLFLNNLKCRNAWLSAFISNSNDFYFFRVKSGIQLMCNHPPFHFGIHFELVYLVTALVPSDTACFASSPGNSRRTAVCTSRLVMVERLLYWVSRDASVAILSKTSLTKEFMMLIALLEIPVSGWTWQKIKWKNCEYFFLNSY